MTRRIQLFEFWAVHQERVDAKGNLVVVGLFEPGQTSPKGSWVGTIIDP